MPSALRYLLTYLLTVVTVVDSARNLGFINDSQLSLDAHVAALPQRLPLPATRTSSSSPIMSTDAAKTLAHAFVTTQCTTAWHV